MYYIDFNNTFGVLLFKKNFQELLLGDATKAKTILGWSPKVNFEVNNRKYWIRFWKTYIIKMY